MLLIFQLCYTFGWILAVGLGYAVVYGPYESAYKDGGFFTKTENVLYGTFSSLAWSIALAWVIYACETGNAGNVTTNYSMFFPQVHDTKSMLSWRRFVV